MDDLKDGHYLLLLVSNLTQSTLIPEKQNSLRIHHIANVLKALQRVEQSTQPLRQIGAEDIVDGNLKLTLGLIWQLILRFQVGNKDQEQLLAWVKGILPNAPEFGKQWSDGVAFCNLVNIFCPLDLKRVKVGSKQDALDNLELSFTLAESLNIPRLLDPEDVYEYGDEKSIITYVSAFKSLPIETKQIEIEKTKEKVEKTKEKVKKAQKREIHPIFELALASRALKDGLNGLLKHGYQKDKLIPALEMSRETLIKINKRLLELHESCKKSSEEVQLKFIEVTEECQQMRLLIESNIRGLNASFYSNKFLWLFGLAVAILVARKFIKNDNKID